MKKYIKSAVSPLSDYSWQDKVFLAKDANSADALAELIQGETMSSVMRAVIFNPNITPEVLDMCVEKSIDLEGHNIDTTVLEDVAENKKTSKSTLIKIVNAVYYFHMEGGYFGVRILDRVALNPNTPLSILRRLSNSDIYDIKQAVVNNPNTSSAILEHIFRKNTEYAGDVFNHPNISKDFLSKMSDSGSTWIRENLAESQQTPPEVLDKLASDRNYYVRQKVAMNDNTPIDTLQRMLSDSDSDIRGYAEASLKCRDFVVGDITDETDPS